MSDDPKQTAALDQLSGLVNDMRAMVTHHYQMLVIAGMATDVSSVMAAELQSTLVAMLLARDEPDDDDDD